MQFDLLENKTILNTIPFRIEELILKDLVKPNRAVHPYHRISCPDWVNILPITSDGKAILIKQTRTGSWKDELETPGGVISSEERDPTMAALRELEEETGFTSMRILSLGSINPNPALFNNRLHMFVALNCVPASDRRHFPDDGEDIRVELHDVQTLDEIVRTGQMNSCLACLTIMLAQKYLRPGNPIVKDSDRI